jgi:A/G-specific adenine glycosylase
MRQMNISGPANSALDPRILEYLQGVLPKRRCGDFNQALMELGALVCTPREPRCNMCPVQRDCRAFAKGCQELIPEPRKVILNEITAVVGVIREGSKFLIQQRPENGLLGGMWEFPGGKVERSDKDLKSALARELDEELGVRCASAAEFCRVQHYYTTNKVKLIAFHVVPENKPGPMAKRPLKWVTLKGMAQYPMPSGSAKIMAALIRGNAKS